MTLPIDLNSWKRPCSAKAVAAIAATASAMDSEWPSEKNKPTETGRLPSCISLRTTLSMGDVVGIDRMAQPEHIGEKGGAEQRRPAGQGDHGPGPDQSIGRQQNNVDRANFAALIGRCVVDRRFQESEHD